MLVIIQFSIVKFSIFSVYIPILSEFLIVKFFMVILQFEIFIVFPKKSASIIVFSLSSPSRLIPSLLILIVPKYIPLYTYIISPIDALFIAC